MLLSEIRSPQDLKKLKIEELPGLAFQIRQKIIKVVCRTGGHLASSLGAVELIIALHYCLDSQDKIIFDIGHQAYAHKLISGRLKEFESLRQYQGLSGFPSKEESLYDVFSTGHSSTAVSLALGLACARDFLPREKYFRVVAVIGDGSLSGGLCFEGLNNVGHLKKDLLVVLNTNELSIAPNVGALSTYLNKIISMPIYNRFRQSLEEFVKARLPKGSRIIKLANRFEETLKGFFVPGIFFEELGFRYFGPFDGHNLSILITTLKNILDIKGPKLFHVVTKKGKGYLPAENEPVRFHSTGPFEIYTGRPIIERGLETYTEVFSKKILDLARNNRHIVAITAAMPEGTGLDKFRDTFPERFFDVGIAESHAVCFAAGLAKCGLKPVVAIYSTFLQRAYDQIMEEVSLQDLAVVFAIDRAGIVGEDGATHQGIFDIAFLKTIPNMVIMAPKNGQELEIMLEFAIGLNKAVAIRYPKDTIPVSDFPLSYTKIKLGKAELIKEGRDLAIFSLGSMVLPSLEAAQLLEKEGLKVCLVNARFAKPLDEELFKDIASRTDLIFTVEEAIIEGGFGCAVRQIVDKPVINIGLPCDFIRHGKRSLLLDKYGLTKEGIYSRIKKTLKENG